MKKRESLRRRVQRAHHGRADVIVGKKGVTHEVLEEIARRLEEKEVVKVKMLRTAVVSEGVDRRALAAIIAERLGARLMGVRGRTFILYKPGKGKDKSLHWRPHHAGRG